MCSPTSLMDNHDAASITYLGRRSCINLTTATSMCDSLPGFQIVGPRACVYEDVRSPDILDQWWTLQSSGSPEVGTSYELDFGSGYSWKAEVTKAEPKSSFEL